MLEFRELCAAYDGVETLHGVNAHLAPGKLTAIIGPNGEFDVYVSSTTTAPTGDPEYFFTSTVVGSKNYGKYENPTETALVEELHQSFDPEVRAELAVKLQQAILDDDAFFFVSHLNMGIVTAANVTGLEAHPCDYYEITADLNIE